MRLTFLASVFTLSLALAQSSTSSSSSTGPSQSSALAPSASASANGTANAASAANGTYTVLTTTITSLIPASSGPSQTSLLTLTLTLGSSAANSTTNGTVGINGTASNATLPWKEGDDWIPFHIRIDPAFGILGALLILSGIPVAGLGGKNRWSSLAIVSGYALMLFTLVMVLRFGVQENLQPPSPSPPSTLLRGLYLLACIVAGCIGAGIGLFFFNISKYLVSGAGGFTFGWFLLAVQPGGLITSTIGRWGLLGGLTVAALLGSIVPKMSELMVLISTAWIGATAFVLGVDCYTRGGLKEFFIYNLGFKSLFPSLNGAKYPLTQTMIIELGILGAVVIIGAAIQARVLNRIQTRLRVAREDEEMREEADEVSRAAKRFKNVGAELQEWEEKHGNGKGVVHDLESGQMIGDGSSSQMPILAKEQDRSTSPALPHVAVGQALFDDSPVVLPSTIGYQGVEELKDDSDPRPKASQPPQLALDPELEAQMKLLEEVRKARESVRGSLNEIRRQTSTASIDKRPDSSGSTGEVQGHGYDRSSHYSIGSRQVDGHSRPQRHSTSSSRVLDGASLYRPHSSSSRLMDSMGDMARSGDYDDTRARKSSSSSQVINSRPVSDASRLISPTMPSPTDWERYTSERQIRSPVPPQNPHHRQSAYDYYDQWDKTASMVDLPRHSMSQYLPEEGRARATSMLPLNDEPVVSRPGPVYEAHRAGQLSSGSRSISPAVRGGPAINPWAGMQRRSMTMEELSDRHHKRLTALQNPVSQQMRQEAESKEARERWERQKREEKREMERKERSINAKGTRGTDKREVLKSTDEWRRSVHAGLDGFGRPIGSNGQSTNVRPVSQSQGHGTRGREQRYSNMIN